MNFLDATGLTYFWNKIKNKAPKTADIANVETSPATNNHKIGDLLMYDGQLYRVKTAITTGNSLTVGTNIEKTSIGECINSIPEKSPKTSGTITEELSMVGCWVSSTIGQGIVHLPFSFNSTSNYSVTVSSLYIEGIGTIAASSVSSITKRKSSFRITFSSSGRPANGGIVGTASVTIKTV